MHRQTFTHLGRPSTHGAAVKTTHKLAPQACVLWLPDRQAYLLRVDPINAICETVTSPHAASRLNDEDAEALGLVVSGLTGLRVAVRPYKPASAA